MTPQDEINVEKCRRDARELSIYLRSNPTLLKDEKVAYIRAKLDAMASNSSQNMIICHNCDSALPEGCGGQFKDDGDACALNAAISAGEWKDE